MTDSLEVRVNRGRTDAVDVPPSFETSGGFDVVVRNEGTPTHVHLHLDDRLSRVADLGADNYYVEGGDGRRVRVEVADEPRPVEGTLEIVTGYGAERARVAIDLVEPEEGEDYVAVDESLARPADPGEPAADPARNWADRARENVPALGVVGVALVLVAASLAAGDAAALVLGLAAVLGGALAAAYFLRSPD